MYLSYYNPLLGSASGVTLQLTSDNKLRIGVIAENVEPNVKLGDGSLKNITIDSTTVLQFARKTTPEIVYKPLRISDITDSSQIATASASTVVLSGGTTTVGGTGADGKSAAIRYASAADGTGFTDVPGTNAYVAIKSFPEDYVPVREDYAGSWHKWDGPRGNGIIYGEIDPTPEVGEPGDTYINTATMTIWTNKTTDPLAPWGEGVKLKGDQGFVGGFGYKYGSSTTEADPGAGWFRFNSANFNATDLTEMYISSTTTQGQIILDILSTMDADDLLFFQPSTTGTEVLYLSINSVTANNNGGWYTISVTYKGGNSLIAFKEYSIGYTKSFGLADALANKVVRYNASGNLIDENNNVISGIMSGTHAQMRALNPADYNREYYHVTDYGTRGAGMRYRSNGSDWVLDGRQAIYDEHPIFKAIFPQTQATAILNNGGKVQITAVGHLLTAAIAVSTTEPCSVYISAWAGTGATAGWYKILSVEDADKYTIDLNYNGAFGTPTITLKGVQAPTPINVALPPLNNHSVLRIAKTCEYTASATSKQFITKLGTTQISNLVQNTAGQVTTNYEYGFRNAAAKNKQESLFAEMSGNVTGQTGSLIGKYTVDTSVSQSITINALCSTANEIAAIRHISMFLEG